MFRTHTERLTNMRQAAVVRALGVQQHISISNEFRLRSQFLADYLVSTDRTALVLAVSGGVDSALAAALCKHAAASVAGGARFVAMRLPYRSQADAADADLVLAAFEPDVRLDVDVAPATDALVSAVEGAGLSLERPAIRDVLIGNVKARQRMVCQYLVAGAMDGLVVGTDHAAEALTGFFTKFGDGGVDVTPLYGLTKSQVRSVARFAGVPEVVIEKTPTADLECDRPQRPDSDVLGLSYDDIDAYLLGQALDPAVITRIEALYVATKHKRAVPAAPPHVTQLPA